MRTLTLVELQQIAGGQQSVSQTSNQKPYAESIYGQIQKSLSNNPELREMFPEEAFPMLTEIFLAGVLIGAVLAAASMEEEEK